jgi:hypothetical protein
MSNLNGVIEARPTEYRGVVFRSRSEAILARVFDLWGMAWMYEPRFLSLGKWTPDFWVVTQMTNGKESPGIMSMVLDYKPNEISQVCRGELAFKFRKYLAFLRMRGTLKLLYPGI